MRNVWLVWRKEMRSYFVSPIAYLLLLMFALIFGFFFWAGVGQYAYYSMESMREGQMYPMNINETLIRGLVSNLNVIGLFFIPLITMRLFAEEKRTGTIELLATSPVHDGEVILGKWLAAVTVYICMLLLTSLNYVYLFKYGNPDWKPLAINYLGLLLETGGLLAIGTFLSTLTRNQIVAGAATFGVCLLLFVLGWVSSYNSATWAEVCSYLSVNNHMDSFLRGTISSKDTVYYLTLTFFGLFLTARSMESLRWRS